MEAENKKKSKSRVMTLTIKAVVLNKNDEVLILRRSKDSKFSAGKYDLPGGHIEEDESLKDSLIREIKEETGLDTEFGEIIDVVEFPKDSPQFHQEKRGIRYICYADSSDVKLSSEHDKFEWISLDRAPERFAQGNGFENEKMNTIIKAQKILEMKRALEGWKRAVADFENYKKREAESRKDMISFYNLNLLMDILPVIDNFQISTEHIPEEQKKSDWVTGIMHIQRQLENILSENGVAEIEVKAGDDFNPAEHEAIEDKSCEKETDKECQNIVKKVVQRGYRIGDRVIRPARVVVE